MTYSCSFVLLLLFASTVAGFFGALLGVGGGIFVVPVMVLMFKLPVKAAVAASIVSVIATSNAGGSSYVDQRIANLRLGMFLEVFTTFGALVGAVLALYVLDWVMLLIFAAVLAYLACAAFSTRKLDDARIRSGEFVRGPADAASQALALQGVYYDRAAKTEVPYVVRNVGVGAAVSVLAGVASGLLGIGGGALKVSAMNRYMNVPMKVAVGTSKLMIGVTAAVSSILFFLAGFIHFMLVGPVAVGTTVGATVGTSVMNRLPSAALKWLFAVLMFYLAYGMFSKGLHLGAGIRLPSAI